MNFVRIATVNDFEKKNIKSFSIFGKRIAIIRRQDLSFYGIEVNCKHQGADLTAGPLEGLVATCPEHQWKYDLETGKCLNHDSPDLKKYAVRLQGDDILISYLPLE